MKKLVATLLLALSSALPTRASAQIVESEWTLTGVHDSYVSFALRFRNTQGYDATKAYGITGVIASYNGPDANLCPAFCGWYLPDYKMQGNVDTSPMDVGLGVSDFSSHALVYNNVNHAWAYFGQYRAATGLYTYGLLGCQRVVATWFSGQTHAGRTCAAEGFDGWLSTEMHFSGGPYVDPQNFTADNFSFGFGVEEFEIQSVVPEPSTYALMALGLLALGIAARARKRTF